MKQGISRKIHLRLDAPSEADSRSDQRRILDALAAEGLEAYLTLRAMQSLPLCAQCGWDVTAHLAWDGARWALTALCASDDTARHYGYAADLGSTGVVMQLIDCGATTSSRGFLHARTVRKRCACFRRRRFRRFWS